MFGQIRASGDDPSTVSEFALQLALDPVLPIRAPGSGEKTLGSGYRLRLAGGAALGDDDPLLGVFGAEVSWVTIEEAEVLQSESFDPGRQLRLLAEPLTEYGSDEAGVRDPDDVRQAGTLRGDIGLKVCAALEHGLPMSAVSVWEERTLLDHRRARLKVLVYSPALVDVAPAPPPVERSSRGSRRRLVLHAGRGGDLRWWDSTATGGPVGVDELPISEDLAAGFESLCSDYLAASRQTVSSADDGFDRLERSWTLEALEAEARELWARARQELGRGHVVGFFGAGMTKPIWTPGEDEDEDEDEDFPF